MILRNTSIVFTKLNLGKTPAGKVFVVGDLLKPFPVTYRVGQGPEVHINTDRLRIWENSGVYRHGDIKQEGGNIVVSRAKMAIIPHQGKDGMEFWLE
jgi:hypothetical protein